ncbi:MAG: dihydrofolate reductase family protein [Verrucomicrobiota bacterium]|jgi:riboflavin-specific deaminase-like protein|nr:diaminohydroxyphosphoribosylaminopyrimidine reductase [Euryarchaeota archaeon]MDP6082692.1 dihydrofolate reductase family protein [Verrucomicrobiota bacterium]MDP6251119.1 dihydrofolate reductase family protein [Verrucomicrobiota bacterium]MDP7176766.1 dihydrofolate reductase family protein [Verrucomicrobiota bacterium]MDP7292181.1 dihydrofolate reductase family protein [Verrucomicrobiota bacterium]|tara:strand:+ start:652 stop:1353 length:702 start_codon:yes stop_codon:yes gene_type:complete
MKTIRPFVLINMAMSADGKIAPAHRRFVSFGSRRDHANLLSLRATADAVMCGARTVDSAPVTLDAGGPEYERRRLRGGLARQNLRIVVSGSGSVDPEAAVFRNQVSPVIVLASSQVPKSRLAKLERLADCVKVCGKNKVALGQALGWLQREWAVNRLLCEGGGELNFELLRLGLVDELHLTICPRIIGGRDAPTIADGDGFATLAKAANLELTRRLRLGDELFTTWRVKPKSG